MSNSDDRSRSSVTHNSSAVGKSLLDDLSVVIVGNKVLPVSPSVIDDVNASRTGHGAEGLRTDCDRVGPATGGATHKRHRVCRACIRQKPVRSDGLRRNLAENSLASPATARGARFEVGCRCKCINLVNTRCERFASSNETQQQEAAQSKEEPKRGARQRSKHEKCNRFGNQ